MKELKGDSLFATLYFFFIDLLIRGAIGIASGLYLVREIYDREQTVDMFIYWKVNIGFEYIYARAHSMERRDG